MGPLSREVSFLTGFQRPSTLLRPAASRQICNFSSASDSPQPRPLRRSRRPRWGQYFGTRASSLTGTPQNKPGGLETRAASSGKVAL